MSKTIHDRVKSHWCIDKNHLRCGGRVAKIKIDHKPSFNSQSFNYKMCVCKCHGQKGLK